MRLVEKRIALVVAGLTIVVLLAVGFLVALGVRSVVAGPDSAPAVLPPNPGHSWSEIGDLPVTPRTGDLAHSSKALGPGWHNVAYLGDTKPISEAFGSIAGSYGAVYHLAAAGTWDRFFPGNPAASNLTIAQYGEAYLMLMTGDAALATERTQVLSIPASQFQPDTELAQYDKWPNQLQPRDVYSWLYYAPIHLPHGATLTGVRACWVDISATADVGVMVSRDALGAEQMEGELVAKVASSGSAGFACGPMAFTDPVLTTIDNTAYVYTVSVLLDGGPDTMLRGVTITYSMTE